jgi:hypothetical protein
LIFLQSNAPSRYHFTKGDPGPMNFFSADGADVPLDYPFPPLDVGRLHALAPIGADAIDGQTWRELLLPAWLGRLADGSSIFGRQWLWRRLHSGAPAAASPRVRALLDDAPARQRLEQACRCLRQAGVEVATPLFAPVKPAPAWLRWIWLLPLAFILSLALIVLWVPGWPVPLGAWIALMVVQLRFEAAVAQWQETLTALGWQLRAHALLGALDEPLAPEFRAAAALAGRLNRKLNPASPASLLPGAREYGNWVLLANVRHYFASRTLFLRERAFLRDSYLLVAELEADLALARHLAGTPTFCWNDVVENGVPALEAAVHPLLAEASALSLMVKRRGAFISGQNGVGKSTLLRTVGINAIAARAFGFCYARAARLPALPVYSSMQGEDSLDGGESLYNAELRRARELLALSQATPALFLIDEIFRGTNYPESVAAAAAVLHELASGALVLVSSHNLVLGSLLEDSLVALCLRRDGKDLMIEPGLLAQTNGLTLLAERGFGAAVEARAARVFDWLSAQAAASGDARGVMAA